MKDIRNKRKKKKIVRKIILLILILFIIAGVWFAYKTHKNGGGLSGMLATAVGHDENTKKNLKEIKVLLLGVSTDLDSQLTDTIIVASYNPNTQKANLLSIPRDTFTGKNKSKATASQKLNAIYNYYRDPQKTLDAVNELTGLDIKYYVLVKTEALIKLVDAIGGVEFNVPIDMYYTDKSQNLVIDLKAGTQIINGEKAEQLLRFRHNNNGSSYPIEYGDNDFGRMRTQRDFIVSTLKQTLKPNNIFKIGEILDIGHENVETNLELSYIKDYIPYAVELNADNIQTAMLPGTTPDISETNRVSVVVINQKEAKELIQSMFYPEENETDSTSNEIETSTTVTTPITIELINGSGEKTKLEKAQKILEEAGYKIKKTGKTSSISKTIITNKKDISTEDLNKLKEILSVGSITTNKVSNSTIDITIIIGRDFE
ncbi:MAG: LCP family protein [Clostridia bacterium]|nr:LCP family protein [Clostridia bacterium]